MDKVRVALPEWVLESDRDYDIGLGTMAAAVGEVFAQVSHKR